jgi:diguanylate cyclase (GGDEF)-like protein
MYAGASPFVRSKQHMAPVASALVGYLSMFLQLGVLVLVTALAMLVRASLGRRAVDGWTLGLAANAAALAVLSTVAVGHVVGVFPSIPWVTVVYCVLEDLAALAFVATLRRERGVAPFPGWLVGAVGLAVAVTCVAASTMPVFFDVYRWHVAGFALLLALGSIESLRARATGIGTRLITIALGALAIDYGHIPLLTLFDVRFTVSYPALESYATMVLDIVLGVAVVVAATDASHRELEARNAALAQAQRALHDAAYLDALCQLPNRTAFLDDIQRPPVVGAVAMIDLDGLKAINDRFGHAAGDAALAATARCMRRRCGAAGTVYRIGGDEFAGIWSGASAEDVRALLTEIDCDLAMLAENAAAPARISWGVAAFTPDAPFAEALIWADTELYERRSERREA